MRYSRSHSPPCSTEPSLTSRPTAIHASNILALRAPGPRRAVLAPMPRTSHQTLYGTGWTLHALTEGLIDIVAKFDLDPCNVAAIAPIIRENGGRLRTLRVSGGSAQEPSWLPTACVAAP